MTREQYISKLRDKWPNIHWTDNRILACVRWVGPSATIDALKENRIDRVLGAIVEWTFAGDAKARECYRILCADDDTADLEGLPDPFEPVGGVL